MYYIRENCIYAVAKWRLINIGTFEIPGINYQNYISSILTATFALKYKFSKSIMPKNPTSSANHPMGITSSIHHRFGVEIPGGKFVEITSIWKRLSESKKYWWVLHVDFSMLFRCRIDVTSLLAVSIVSFPNILYSGKLF